MIGGTLYLATTATAITGTPSDFVKITPSGATAAAAYVTNLTGVTWNSVWNFYEDVSGNAYLFDEAKQVSLGVITSPKTILGLFAKGAYILDLNVANNVNIGNDLEVGGMSTYLDLVKWKYYFSATSASSGDVFTGINSWIPNNGDYMPIHGVQSFGNVVLVSIYRFSATVIYLNALNVITGSHVIGNIVSGSGSGSEDYEIMSNFNAMT
jgi:hypothetical protein